MIILYKTAIYNHLNQQFSFRNNTTLLMAKIDL